MPYIGKSSDGFGIRERYRYSASGSQTAFTGSDLDSKTLQIDSGSLVDVYLNGVLLDTADYNTNTANQVSLTSGATASDEVMIIVYDVFALSDAMPKTGGAFTGNVTGTAMVHLLSADITSAVSAYDIGSTYINSTYDNYLIQAEFLPATDNVFLYLRFFVGGVVQTSLIYATETEPMSTYLSANVNSGEAMGSGYYQLGNATGEGITLNANLQNVNNTARPCSVTGMSNTYYTNAVHSGNIFSGSLIVANASNVVNGFRFYMSSGDIASGTVKLYGLKD
tara:strand:- start:1628 stop:2467 length:840 start_codon:yes stop_codon:yes gene_type:complete